MLKISQKGDLSKVTAELERMSGAYRRVDFDKYGREGVDALKKATPTATGKTASLWRYEVHKSKNRVELAFYNDSNSNGVPIVILLEYGHVSRNGSWVKGEDFINPALKPIFDELRNNLWKEVTGK